MKHIKYHLLCILGLVVALLLSIPDSQPQPQNDYLPQLESSTITDLSFWSKYLIKPFTTDHLFHNSNILQQLYWMVRIKKWDVIFIFAKQFTITLKVVNIGIMGVVELEIRNNTDHQTIADKQLVPVHYLKHNDTNITTINHTYQYSVIQVSFQFNQSQNQGQLKVSTDQYDLDFQIKQYSNDSATIATYNRIDQDPRFHFNSVKRYGLQITGIINGQQIDADGLLDLGRGVWPYHTYWRWATGTGHFYNQYTNSSNRIDINLGGGYIDPHHSKCTEDALFIDKQIFKLNQSYIQIDIDAQQIIHRSKQIINDRDFYIVFDIQSDNNHSEDFLVIRTNMQTYYGSFRGYFISNQTKIEFSNIPGFIELFQANW